MDSDFRFRYAQATFENGDRCLIVFEPLFGINAIDYKNTHVVQVQSGGKIVEHWSCDNQFETALMYQLQSIMNPITPSNQETLIHALQQQQLLETMNLPQQTTFQEISYAM